MKLTNLPGVLRRTFGMTGFVRAHERLSCATIGSVLFIERGCRIDGLVDEFSRGGIRLRPAKKYILKRMGENVAVRVSFAGLTLNAVLVNTSPHGYGFKLDRLLQSDEVDAIVAADAANGQTLEAIHQALGR